MTVDAISNCGADVPGDAGDDAPDSGATVVAAHDLAGFGLVASVEPSVVFSSLAALCVPELCDHCTIDIVDGPRARYRIAYPPRHDIGAGLRRIADRAHEAPDHRVQVPFAHRRASVRIPSTDVKDGHLDAEQGETERGEMGQGEFHGVATFVWHYRMPTRADRAMAAVLTDHAVGTVVWQRSEHAASAAFTNVAHLRIALETSRNIGAAIGILMSQHKINQEQAFGLLRTASQHGNRKVRDLALDVIDTGWLDPVQLTGPRRLSRSHGEHHASDTVSEIRHG